MTANASAEAEVRELINRWADAIRARDIDTVVADHSDDVVMFDVPPPYDGVRGLRDYRDSWPPFFEFLSQGATFEITELDVTADDDVAFAFGLLRCGKPAELEARPDHRLRLTIGLQKRDGRWIVTHEHHSFPIAE